MLSNVQIAMTVNIICVFTFYIAFAWPMLRKWIGIDLIFKSVSSYVKVHFVMAVSYILQYHNKR